MKSPKRFDAQNREVLRAMLQHPITIRWALAKGITRLAARVYDLKKAGYQIDSKSVRLGDSRVAQYTIASKR